MGLSGHRPLGPERNVREFLEALPEWRKHGVLAFTVNLQGGSPEGYSKSQPWENTPSTPKAIFVRHIWTALRAYWIAPIGWV